MDGNKLKKTWSNWLKIAWLFVQGSYSELTDARIKALTQEELLDTVNNKNVSGIFMKVELLQFDIDTFGDLLLATTYYDSFSFQYKLYKSRYYGFLFILLCHLSRPDVSNQI